MTDSASRILLVDDEPDFLRLCAGWLAAKGYHVSTAADARQAEARYSGGHFDLVLLDLAMPPNMDPQQGLDLIPVFDRSPVIVLTGHAQRDLALKAVAGGAWDFLAKPVDPNMLQIVVQRALIKQGLVTEIEALKQELASRDITDDFGIIGNSPAITELRRFIDRIGPSAIPVLILGASGTGKELVAQAIHRRSERSQAPFVPVNCGAISENLFESEFFGHVKGSFTGATANRTGLIASAHGGTLFLDEIGDMPLAMQVKLLRFLQEGVFTPVGSDQISSADVRVISATHRDLATLIDQQTFREDLYYRIKGMEVRIPPLRERVEDILPLAKYFLMRYANPDTLGFDGAALEWILEQDWNGNARELEHCVASAVALGGAENQISREHLQMRFTPSPESSETGSGLAEKLASLEKRLIVAALEQSGQNRTQAATHLGISRAGLLKKMARFGLR